VKIKRNISTRLKEAGDRVRNLEVDTPGRPSAETPGRPSAETPGRQDAVENHVSAASDTYLRQGRKKSREAFFIWRGGITEREGPPLSPPHRVRPDVLTS